MVNTGYIIIILLNLGLISISIIPIVIYTIFWGFVLHTVTLKGKSGFKAMKYSQEVVKGNWWKIFGYTLIFIAPNLIHGILIRVITRAIPTYNSMISSIGFSIIMSTVSIIVLTPINSFIRVVKAVLFINQDALKKD